MKAVLTTLTLAAALCPVATAQAQAGIRVYSVERVRVDGSLRDWRDAHFADVGSGDDASMRFALGADDQGLYVAAEVRDDRMVRTSSPGANEDAVVLTLSIGRGRRARLSDIYLFAGVSGRTAATAGISSRIGGRPRTLAGARVVEGPRRRGRGYVLEAFIPFGRIPGGARWEEGRATVRLRDVDSEAHPEVESEPAFVATDALVPLMPAGGASGVLEQFLASRGLGAARPSHTLRGDVSGDRQPERVFIVDRYVVVTGPGYAGGRGYSFHQLAVSQPSDVRDAELRDLTGDGKSELVTVIRQRNDQGARDLWQVISFAGNDPRPIWAIEVRKQIGNGSVEARIRVLRGRGGQAPEIEITAHRAQGLDRESYRETPADDAQPMLLPWGPIRSRRYRWSGSGFTQTSERPNPRYRPPAEPSSPSSGGGRRATPEPAAPSRPSASDLLAEFRRRSRIRRGTPPRPRIETNIAGGREPETVHVYGRRVVIVGPGIRNGESWMNYEIPAASDQDVVSVRAADVTGDHRAELLFTVRQHFDQQVTRDVLIVHQVTPQGFPRLLQVEVARRAGTAFIQNEVLTRGGRLEIRPGRAREWNAETYRFGRSANDSAEPLLLPWSDRPVRYRLRGGRLTH